MTYPGGDYQGLGFYPGPPRRDRRLLVIIVSVAAIVLVVGAVVAIILLQRQSSTPAAPTSSTGPTSTTSSAAKTTTTTEQAGRKVENDTAKLSYVVPDSWTPIDSATPITLKALPGVSIDHLVGLTEYQCGGKSYSRGVVGGGKVARGELNQRATEIAQAFGKQLYTGGSGVEVVPGTPEPVTAATGAGTELKGVRVTAAVTSTGDACLAGKGELVVVLLDDGTDLRLLLVNGDTEGGPATPPPARSAELDTIADSVRPLG
ncbi:hypothetical protein [Actinokineospora terrae]|uniref:DUF8017 domain-containing protein n=1 Tax=Actinokineospora terrae TaxID=155974 RepID=A0A1H9TF16_9PSEU|nr:hypothetical protein [Actinokineospora terrae]SER95815.1 hypothetical protein SAMN04487818_106245 [Actinokineospora terrae]